MSGHRVLIGLIGANIQRSLSPALHEDALAAAGLVGRYHLFDLDQLTGEPSLAAILQGLRQEGYAGVNVTHPCKEAVLPLLDALSPEAAEIGAVNTVVFSSDGQMIGHNTDRIGFRLALSETLGPEAVADKVVLVIGAGGAGKAVSHALLDLQPKRLLIHDIVGGRADALAASLGQAQAVEDPAVSLETASGVVNATPIGMLGHPGQPLALELLRPDLWVGDVVYTPLETRLVAEARRRGCRVLTGGGMCVYQAAAAFRLFTGRTPDVVRMSQLFDRLCAARDAGMVADGNPLREAREQDQ